MNTFRVEPNVFRRFPGMQLVIAVTHGLRNESLSSELGEFWRDAWLNVSELDLIDARKHPHIDDWRTQFRELGVSMKRFPTSIEALLRRALKGGELFRINPLVDFYNALSLRHVCPAGAFDLDALDAPIALRFTGDGDQFQALDSDDVIAVSAGEIGYLSGNNVLTRHFMWRQSRLALVSADSRNIFMVSEVPAAAGNAVAAAMENSMRQGLEAYFNCQCQTFVMAEGDESIEWSLPAPQR